jgi:cell cycle sensor histidine kinase DivJ
VRLHGGEISIRSRIGEGTRVTVRLPLDCEGAQPAKPAAPGQSTVSYLANNVTAHPALSGSPREDALPRSNISVKKRA